MLLGAAGVSQLGTQVRLVALPLVAVVAFGASPWQTGLLVASESVSVVLIGLPAGAWVDRVRRRPLMVAGDLVRAGLLASIPVAAWFGVLVLWQLYLVAFGVGLASVLFDVASMTYLPTLVGRDQILTATSRLEVVESSATAVGPGLGGLLVRWLTAPVAIVADATSYLASAVLLLGIRADEAPEQRAHGTRLLPEVVDGWRLVLGNPLLRAVAATGALVVLFESVLLSVQAIFLVREQRVDPGAFGAILMTVSVGTLLGALAAGWLAQRWGALRTLRRVPTVSVPILLLAPLTTAHTLVLYPVGAAVSGFGLAVFNVTQLGLRQQLCPEALRGRMNATMRFLMWSAIPLGGLLGGALGELVGPRATVATAAIGMCVALVPVWTATGSEVLRHGIGPGAPHEEGRNGSRDGSTIGDDAAG